MKDLIFTIDANTRKVKASKNFLGITGEHLQGKIIFDFTNEFIDGIGYLEVDNGNKYLIMLDKEDEHYSVEIRSSLLTQVGKLKIQLRVDVAVENEESTAIFKSQIIELPVLEAINATIPIPEDYPTWLEEADAKLLEVDQAITDMETQVGNAITEMENTFSNSNLLINSNFAINQRGQSSYTGTNIYTVDRVIKYINNGAIEPISNGGLTINNVSGSGNCDYAQIIENGYNLFNGQYVTLSANIDGVIYTVTHKVATGTSNRTFIQSGGTNRGELNIQTTSNNIFKVWGRAYAGKSYNIYWWKLELGDKPTIYTPPLIAEELSKCQRYYIKYVSYKTSGYLTSSGKNYTMPIYLPTTMRTQPTVTTGTWRGRISTGYSAYTNSSFVNFTTKSVTSFYNNTFTLIDSIATAVDTNNINIAYEINNLELDAEIY